MDQSNSFNRGIPESDRFEDNFRYAADADRQAFDRENDREDQRVGLDRTDDDGELLNEEVDRSGRDLDIPGAEDDDEMEDIGEEDEENNSYSLSDNNDNESAE